VNGKFFNNLLLLLFLNLLVKPFWILGIDRTIQNEVGTEVYGMFFSLLNFSWLFTIFLDFGINNFNNREISRHGQMLRSYLSKIIGLKLFLGAIYLIISISIAFIIGYDKIQIELLLLILFNQFLHFFNLYLRSNISGLQLFKQDSLISVSDRFFLILICSILLWGNVVSGSFQIEWLVYAQSFSYLLTSILASIFIIRKTGLIPIRINMSYFSVILKNSYPYALLSLLMVIYYRIDSVMLERLLPDGLKQAGIYAQSYRLLDTFSMFPFLFSTLLLPMFSRMLAKNESVSSLSKFSFSLVIIPIIGLVIPCIAFAEEILELLYHDVPSNSPTVFRILMLSLVFISGSYIFGTLLTADSKLKFLNKWALISVFLNISLNIILIQEYKAIGCAVASLATQALMFLVQFSYVCRSYKFNFDFILFGKSTIIILCIGILSYLALQYASFKIWLIIIIPTATVFFSFLFKVFRISSIIELLKSKLN